MSSKLLGALSKLLPAADFRLLSVRPWHSLALSGAQLCLSATVTGKDHRRLAANFARILPEHDFTLDRLVADIAVTGQVTNEADSQLVIHALLLDD